VARDHLASERTFMAYVRTSLALATAGIGRTMVVHLVHKWLIRSSSSVHAVAPDRPGRIEKDQCQSDGGVNGLLRSACTLCG
jgi:Domain of unknown function (DUF202)